MYLGVIFWLGWRIDLISFCFLSFVVCERLGLILFFCLLMVWYVVYFVSCGWKKRCLFVSWSFVDFWFVEFIILERFNIYFESNCWFFCCCFKSVGCVMWVIFWISFFWWFVVWLIYSFFFLDSVILVNKCKIFWCKFREVFLFEFDFFIYWCDKFCVCEFLLFKLDKIISCCFVVSLFWFFWSNFSSCDLWFL